MLVAGAVLFYGVVLYRTVTESMTDEVGDAVPSGPTLLTGSGASRCAGIAHSR